MNPTPSTNSAAAAPVPSAAGVEPEPAETVASAALPAAPPREFGGRKDGTEPTRFGDWEKNGRCVDF